LTQTTTLAELAATSLGAVRILENLGLDYCCGGKQSLDQACRTKGIDAGRVLDEIAGASQPAAGGADWRTAPLQELARHILRTHHEYLKLNLPAIGQRLQKVVSVHGAKDPDVLPRMLTVYAGLREELESHLHKEEAILFPFIEEYGRAEASGAPLPPVPFGSIANPIRMMEMEHTSAGGALAELRSLTRDYTLPEYACATVQALYAGLRDLESDLHVHIHLENNILFPRAVALERRSA
jgi:regulator of cell morphogenesis and NO signaling